MTARGPQRLAGLPFRLASALRGTRMVHPQGIVVPARWRIDGDCELVRGAAALAPGFAHDAVVRCSRGAGLPERLPDIIGFAVRLPGAYGAGRHQDVLLCTSARPPLLRNLFLPTAGWFASQASTVLPYRTGAGARFVIGLEPPRDRDAGPGLDGLRRALAEQPVVLGIAVASPTGPWQRIGTLTLLAPGEDDEALTFNPWNTGGGLRPSGLLNRWRRPAYAESQRGRGAPGRRARRGARWPGVRRRRPRAS